MQASLSLQTLVACAQPVTVSQESSVQASRSLQSTGTERHLPLRQWSFCVQAFESEQTLKLLGMLMQAPLSGSHSSSVQLLPSLQSLPVPPAQVPASHSPTQQASLPEHELPSARSTTMHSLTFAGSQLSNWHDCSRRPKSHWESKGTHEPAPLHSPSHTVLAASGRQPAPAGALSRKQLLP